MRSPFPGVDPYLENPLLWHPFHTRLIVGLADLIDTVLPPAYYVSVEERTSVSRPASDGIRLPDVAVAAVEPSGSKRGTASAVLEMGVEVQVPAENPIRERYLEIRSAGGLDELVTVIEILSPTNKLPGNGRDEYLLKRGAITASETNLVEIDLQRAGPRMPAQGSPADYDYGVLICRASQRPRAQLLPFSVRDPIPVFPLPLQPGEVEPRVAFGRVYAEVYERGRYASRVDYTTPPDPPLRAEDAEWAVTRLREAGLR